MVVDKVTSGEVHASNATSGRFGGNLGRVRGNHLDGFKDCGAREADRFARYGAIPVATVLCVLARYM